MIVDGVVCYGQPIGTVEFVAGELASKAEEVVAGITEVKHVLMEKDPHSCWAVLSQCNAVQFTHWLQLSYPSDVAGPARTVDRAL